MVDYLQLGLIALIGLVFLLFNELEDESVRSTWKKNKHFLNLNESWKNKWKWNNGHLITATKKWYYFGINPKHKERFYLSSTVLVFITDGEHLFQFIKKRSIEAGFLLIDWKYYLAWMAGTILMQLIKEKFLKSVN